MFVVSSQQSRTGEFSSLVEMVSAGEDLGGYGSLLWSWSWLCSGGAGLPFLKMGRAKRPLEGRAMGDFGVRGRWGCTRSSQSLSYSFNSKYI